MADLSLNATTTTGMNSSVPNFKVQPMRIEESTNDENYYYNTNFPTYLGYLKKVPELYSSVIALNQWAFGLGYTTDSRTAVVLKKIKGWGEDTFDSIINNQGVVEDFNGDAYCEIIKDPDISDKDIASLINLKPLNPENVRHVTNRKGLLIRYDVWNGKEWKEMPKEKIFHTCGGRIASENHGTSKIEAVKWVIDARNEAMADKRRIMHRSTIRVIEVDSEDTAKYSTLKNAYADAIKNGEVMVVPKGNVQFPDVPSLTTAEHSEWIRYLESFYYKAFGTPEVILGGANTYTEAGSKVGFMTFEVPYSVKQRNMEMDLLNQLGIEITFNRPPSLLSQVQNSEAANTGQISIQPNEVTAQPGKVE